VHGTRTPGAATGTGAGQARPTQDMSSLNRDYQDRRGGYQSYERRAAPRSSGMNRGMRSRRR